MANEESKPFQLRIAECSPTQEVEEKKHAIVAGLKILNKSLDTAINDISVLRNDPQEFMRWKICMDTCVELKELLEKEPFAKEAIKQWKEFTSDGRPLSSDFGGTHEMGYTSQIGQMIESLMHGIKKLEEHKDQPHAELISDIIDQMIGLSEYYNSWEILSIAPASHQQR